VRKLETNDSDEYDQLCAEQAKLEVFEPVMKHALDDNKPPVVFHCQLVQDFLTVEEIAGKVLTNCNIFTGQLDNNIRLTNDSTRKFLSRLRVVDQRLEG
jgi:hypothetical protein